MTRLQVAALVALMVGGAGAAVVRALWPRHAVAWGGLRRDAVVDDPGTQPSVASGPLATLARYIERRAGDGLRLVELDAEAVAARLLIGLAAGGLGTVVAVGGLIAAGRLPASPLWLAVAGAMGLLAAWTLWRDVLERITRRRRDLTRAGADLVQLVAVGLTTDQSVDEAVRFALALDRGPDFARFRHEVTTAPLRGLTVWEALDRLGNEYDLRELRELATAVERQGLQGVPIATTVASMATALRERALDHLEREADRANASLAGPTLCFVVTTLVFLAYPLAMRIGEAFGG